MSSCLGRQRQSKSPRMKMNNDEEKAEKIEERMMRMIIHFVEGFCRFSFMGRGE